MDIKSYKDQIEKIDDEVGVFHPLLQVLLPKLANVTYVEYLYAQDAHAIRDMKIDKRVFHPYWTNTYFFYIGLLSECPEVLQELVAMEPEGENASWVKLLQMSQYLLAGYQTPYVVVEQNLHHLIVEAATLYTEILKGNTATKLSSLSEMNLLWLFATLLKNGYGYEFFKKALPLAMAQIDDSELIERDVKIVALFLAAVILGELDDKCGFHYLLMHYKLEELPLSISLGVKCEVEFENKDFAKDLLIKTHIKKLKKSLSPSMIGDLNARQKISALFEMPVKNRFEKKANKVKKDKDKPLLLGKKTA